MEILRNKEKVRAFYKMIGNWKLSIGDMSVSEAEKERSYLLVDELLREYEDNLEGSLKLNASLARLERKYERLGDVALGLEDFGESPEESRRDEKNVGILIQILGLERFYSERDLGVSGR